MPNPLITDHATPVMDVASSLEKANGTHQSDANGTLPANTNGSQSQLATAAACTSSGANGTVSQHVAASASTVTASVIRKPLEGLLEKLQQRQATIGVLGLGYVGLPLIMAFGEADFNTIGFDTKASTVEALQRGESHIGDIPSATVATLRQTEKFTATTDFMHLRQCDVAIICVPTPLTEMREPDLTAVRAACRAVRDNLHSGQLVILESTTYPGTTDEVMRPLLEETGLKAGEDFFLAFSPERIDPGNEQFPVHKVPKVVGGYTPACQQAAVALYDNIVERTVPVSSTQAAELTKLLENIFRSVNIALVNEMAMLCDRMGIDIWEVIEAAATKPYGFTKFLPGPGLGGHCIPIDPFYLSWKARQYDFYTHFIELAGEVNRTMPRYVVDKIMRALNDQSKALRGSRVGILGMSYKPNVGDSRESPSLRVAQLLIELGAEVLYHDPYIDSVQLGDEMLESQPLAKILESECVALLTDHRDFDYAHIAANTRLVVDTRNAFKSVQAPAAQIIKI